MMVAPFLLFSGASEIEIYFYFRAKTSRWQMPIYLGISQNTAVKQSPFSRETLPFSTLDFFVSG
jgi:hypothetical protein